MELRPGMFAHQQQSHHWSGASEFKAGQAGEEREKKKMIEVQLKFYTLVFIYVVFLEGAAWTAGGLCKNPTKTREMLCNHTEGHY